ncbi:uncharacterized protein MYCFIDRAFT_161314, partial [Pseudocercospora fijiensis CIRAD86]
MSSYGIGTIGRFFKYTVLPFQMAVCTTIFINDSVVEVASVNGDSMHPTLSPDYSKDGSRDYVIWKKWNATKNLQRGDIVLFHSLQNPENLSIKRVVALGGDTVVLDPKRRPEEEIPEGHVWVEGDNWRSTHDSNAYGPISKSSVLGKAIGIFKPFGQFGSKPWEGYK